MIRIHPEAVMYEYDSEYLPLTDADYDIWGKGLRNLFRMVEDKATGDIYMADVGQITVEVHTHKLLTCGFSQSTCGLCFRSCLAPGRFSRDGHHTRMRAVRGLLFQLS